MTDIDPQMDDAAAMEPPAPLPPDPAADKAVELLKMLGVEEQQQVLRMKGFIAVAGKPMRLLVQAVGARVTHQFDRPWGAAPRAGRLVVIGLKGLDRTAVARALEETAALPA